MRYLILTDEEVKLLEDLHQNSLNKTVRKRSQCFILSHNRHGITDLSSIFKVSRRSIERWFDSWAEIGTDSLGIARGRGAKTLLKEYSKEVCEYHIIICKKTLQNFLKVNGL